MAEKFIYYPIGAIITGKPQIYVGGCYDESEMFKHTYELLLAACPNAIIWVKTDPEACKEDNFEALMERMNLAVFTISNEAIQDRAFQIEVNYVFEHNIPFLPLIQKGVDRSGFEKVFGKVQYLDESNDDSTALPFKDKLKNYLNELLISDEQRERIKNVFRANIFLSYRKKDRAHANRIMKVIHEHEELRDIAIWYDEFLVPGEDYNEEIQSFLKESDLFVLAVTPNILEDGNYVMVHEFPDAKALGKTIVPIEAVPADEEEIKKNFIGIPEIKSTDDPEKIAETLVECLGSKVRPDIPEKLRNYYLGLAYLMGVGVEKNIQYALEYLEKAARGGLKNAYDKLISMYENGEGVKRNLDKAMEWDMNLLKAVRSQVKPDSKLTVLCLFKYARLTIAWYDLHNGPLIFSPKAKTPEEAEEEKKKEAEMQQKDREEKDKILGYAKKPLEDGKVILKDLLLEDVDFYMDKMAEYYEICHMLHDRHYAESEEEVIKCARDAVEHNRFCLETCKKYLDKDDPSIPVMQERLGKSLMMFGDVLMVEFYRNKSMGKEISPEVRKKEDAARDRYIEATGIFQELSQKDDSIKIKRQLVKGYSFFIGNLFLSPDWYKTPKDDIRLYANRCISLMTTIYLQTGSPADGRELATAYFQRGRADDFQGDSVHYLEKAVEIQEKCWNELKRSFSALAKGSNDILIYQLELNHYKGILEKKTEEQS